jgi:hypothetical protein
MDETVEMPGQREELAGTRRNAHYERRHTLRHRFEVHKHRRGHPKSVWLIH